MTPDWISAIGTVGAVAVALFLFFWDRWSGKATLGVILRPEPPDWSFATLGHPTEEEPTQTVFVLRLAANNRGRATARTVEAIIHQVEQQKDGAWVPVQTFLPSNLRWTHTADRQLHLLVPEAPKLFDLGEVQQNGPADCILLVAITPQPTRAYNIFFPGMYRFSITLAAENAPAAHTRFELSFFPKWSSSDEAMICGGIKLTEVSS